jgi:hypothetical protein
VVGLRGISAVIVVGAVLAAAAGSGCAWDPVSDGGYATVRFRVADLREKVAARLAPDSEGQVPGGHAPDGHAMDINYPASLATFDCLAINVTGPGVSPSVTTFQNFNNHAGLRAGNTCAYLGVTSGLIAMTGASSETVEMRVPLGPDRLIQVFGVKTSSGLCTDTRRFSDNFHAFRTGGATTITEAYEVGRTIKSVFGDTTAPVDSSFSVNNPKPFHDCDSYAYQIMNDSGLLSYWRFQESPSGTSITNATKIYDVKGGTSYLKNAFGATTYATGILSTVGATLASGSALTGSGFSSSYTATFTGNKISVDGWVKATADLSGVASGPFLYLNDGAGVNPTTQLKWAANAGTVYLAFTLSDTLANNLAFSMAALSVV